MFTFSLLCFRTDVPRVKCLSDSGNKVAVHTCVGGKGEIQTQDLGVKERQGEREREKMSGPGWLVLSGNTQCLPFCTICLCFNTNYDLEPKLGNYYKGK